MVQSALDLLWSVLAGWHTFFRWMLWLGVIGGGVLLFLRLFRRESYDRLLPRLRETLLPLGNWGAALLVFALAYSALGVLGQVVLHRVSAGDSAGSSRSADPDAAPTTQDSPRVTYLTEKTYTRSLVIPPDLLKRVRLEGVQALSPYLTDPTSENVTKLRDRFRRSGQDVIFTREATLLGEEPIKLDRSRMNLNLDFVSPLQGARRSYYKADFSAQYAFTNPLKTPVTARFVFPLPQGSGTLSDFQVVVDGQELSAADLVNGNGWEGQLLAGQTVNVKVNYRHQGARGWSYLLGARREPIRDFALTVKTNQPAKFKRYSLYPNRLARTLGGTNLAWDLKNVITAQDISLTFTASSLRETLTKLYAFAPLALLLAGLFGALWTRWRGLSVQPLQVGLAALGILAGTAFGGVLMNYLPAYAAGVLGAALAAALALRSLGLSYWPPVLIAAALPLAFLLVGHAGLIIVGTGLLVLATLIWTQPRRQPPQAAAKVETWHLAARPEA